MQASHACFPYEYTILILSNNNIVNSNNNAEMD